MTQTGNKDKSHKVTEWGSRGRKYQGRQKKGTTKRKALTRAIKEASMDVIDAHYNVLKRLEDNMTQEVLSQEKGPKQPIISNVLKMADHIGESFIRRHDLEIWVYGINKYAVVVKNARKAKKINNIVKKYPKHTKFWDSEAQFILTVQETLAIISIIKVTPEQLLGVKFCD